MTLASLFAIFTLPTPWSEVHKDWNNHLNVAVAREFENLDRASDVDEWCPGYKTLGQDKKVMFWSDLAIWISFYESSWKPSSVAHEPSPLDVDSVGLFQMAYKNHMPWCLPDKSNKTLEDPLLSIDCAIPMFGKLIKRDGLLATGDSLKNARGLARYWSTVWPKHKFGGHREDIQQKTREACVSRW